MYTYCVTFRGQRKSSTGSLSTFNVIVNADSERGALQKLSLRYDPIYQKAIRKVQRRI